MSKDYYTPNDGYFTEDSTDPSTTSSQPLETSYNERSMKLPTEEYGRVKAVRRIVGRVSKQD